jgi:hypothetical protein
MRVQLFDPSDDSNFTLVEYVNFLSQISKNTRQWQRSNGHSYE